MITTILVVIVLYLLIAHTEKVLVVSFAIGCLLIPFWPYFIYAAYGLAATTILGIFGLSL